MARKNADDRQVEVLDETLNQIRKLGMSAVRVADIAKAMGVSPSLIMYHFDTKERLLSEALIRASERDLAALGRITRGADTPIQQLMGALEWYSPTGSARGWRVWIDAWSVSLRDPTIAKVTGELKGRWVEVIAEAIGAGVAEGVFTTDDPIASALRFTDILDGLAIRIVVHRTPFSQDDLAELLDHEVAVELGCEIPR